MISHVLDTDILSLFQRGHAVVTHRVNSYPLSALAVTVITVEEQLSGWYTLLRQSKRIDQRAACYERLAQQVSFLAGWTIRSFPESALQRYEGLAKQKLGVGKKDLCIAAITLELGATVVTRNVRDFTRVPGLKVEDWSV
jgi:tRNA(fMet)-specific endonuclease VapC